MKHLWKIDHQRKSFFSSSVPQPRHCSKCELTHMLLERGTVTLWSHLAALCWRSHTLWPPTYCHWRPRQQQESNSQARIDKTGSYNGATSLFTLTLFSVKSGSKRLESGSNSALHKPTFHFPFRARKLDIKWPRKPKARRELKANCLCSYFVPLSEGNQISND